MGLDAINGKAERKGRAWLISRITGVEVTDGDVEDAKITVVSTKTRASDEQIEEERWLVLLKEATTIDDLVLYKSQIPVSLQSEYDARMKELGGK